MSRDDPRRQLPPVDRLVRELGEAEALPEWARREAARSALSGAREAIGRGEATPDVFANAIALARRWVMPSPRRVVNATGVVLHTNLGRSALAPGAAEAVAEAAAHYSDLELDLETGARGQRVATLADRLCLLAGAPAAHVVNNCAGAVLLALAALAHGREVIVSRGELVEIGGSFRVPEILEQAGVKLVEVGTTNRTHPRDYEHAIGPDTAVLLKVHRSNFEQRGFVTEVSLAEMAEIGQRHGVPVVEDLGSGTLVDLRSLGLPEESFAPARLATGVDCICFSGDKLLGGPQAGVILGKPEIVGTLRANPLARALRQSKLEIAALDWTVRALLDDRVDEIPTLRQLREPLETVEARAQALWKRIDAGRPGGVEASLEAVRSPVGGGSLPGFELPSLAVALALPGRSANALAAALRDAPVPVVARVTDDRVLLDARTLLPNDEDAIEIALRSLEAQAS